MAAQYIALAQVLQPTREVYQRSLGVSPARISVPSVLLAEGPARALGNGLRARKFAPQLHLGSSEWEYVPWASLAGDRRHLSLISHFASCFSSSY